MLERTLSDQAMKVPEAIGQSEAFLEFQERLSRVAPINRPVLLLGERGTGKELAASRLHYLSNQWQGPFVALNCSALSPSLIEAELFGHEKGSFTGAEKRRVGRFEAADNGSLFLDEIGAIPMEAQEKILRVVEYNTFERVGSSMLIEVDVRTIAATNADLTAMVKQGRFKPDLLDRLSFEVLVLPPLRERIGDIPLLADHFAARMSFEMEKAEVPRFSDQALASLEAYTWPGNVRELKNIIERAVYRSDSSLISEIEFDPLGLNRDAGSGEKTDQRLGEAVSPFEYLLSRPFYEAIDELKAHLLKEALKKTRYHQKIAAQRLGLTYDQFRGMYRKYKTRIDG